jgi:hypothetical protein
MARVSWHSVDKWPLSRHGHSQAAQIGNGRKPPTTAARSGCPQRRVAHRHRPFVPPRARPEVLTRIVAVPPRAVADAPTVLIVYASGVAAQTARPRRAPDKRRESQRWRRRVARSCRQCARPALRRPARLRVQVRHDAVTPKVSALSAECPTAFLRPAASRFVGGEAERWPRRVRSLSLFEPSPPSPLMRGIVYVL